MEDSAQSLKLPVGPKAYQRVGYFGLHVKVPRCWTFQEVYRLAKYVVF